MKLLAAIPRTALVASFIFLGVTLIRMSRHELWRDEIDPWIQISDASSFADLITALDYTGHPMLWTWLLVPLNYLFTDPWAMQVLHALIASSSIYLLVRFSPFSLSTKLLLSCSYFLAFEYAVVSRQYALIVLALFALLSVKKRMPNNLTVPALLMVIMAEASVHGMIIAIAMTVALLFDHARWSRYSKQQLTLGICILIVGLTVATIDMLPNPDHVFARGWSWRPDAQEILKVLSALWHAYFPLGYNHWDINTFIPKPGYLAAILSIAFLIAIVFALRKSQMALSFFLVATAGLLLFFYAKYFGYLRHHGMIFIVMIAALWLMLDERTPEGKDHRSTNFVLYPVLIIQLYTCVVVSYMDWSYPFSGAQAVAQYIREMDLEDHPKLGHKPHPMSGISWDLNEKIYLMQMKERSRRVIWDSRFNKKLSRKQIATLAQGYTDQVGRPTLLILNQSSLQQPLTEFHYLGKIPDVALVLSETFHLYLVHPRGYAEN